MSGTSSNCLDEITLAELADGTATRERRERALAHMATCRHCRTELASLLALLADENISAELAHLDHTTKPGSSWRKYAVGGGAIAAAIVIAVAWPHEQPTDRSHRAPTITASAAPTLVGPVGNVAQAPTLRWNAVAGANRYRVTLYDDAGQVLYESQLADTAVTLPDSVTVVPSRSYLWKVEARTGFERWSSSELTQFTVIGTRR